MLQIRIIVKYTCILIKLFSMPSCHVLTWLLTDFVGCEDDFKNSKNTINF